MRTSDFHSADRRLEGWIAPLERVNAWVQSHEDRVHKSARGRPRFLKVWRRLAYLHFETHGGDIDDDTAEAVWLALSLRDLREAPDFPRMYAEAEWEILAELVAGDPPVNGEALYDQATDAPILHYQFHGLPKAKDGIDLESLFDVMLLGDAGRTVDGVRHSGAAGILASGNRPAHEDCVLLSRHLNVLRVSRGLEPLEIGEGRTAHSLIDLGLFGLLIELEDGSTITLPQTSTLPS